VPRAKPGSVVFGCECADDGRQPRSTSAWARHHLLQGGRRLPGTSERGGDSPERSRRDDQPRGDDDVLRKLLQRLEVVEQRIFDDVAHLEPARVGEAFQLALRRGGDVSGDLASRFGRGHWLASTKMYNIGGGSSRRL